MLLVQSKLNKTVPCMHIADYESLAVIRSIFNPIQQYVWAVTYTVLECSVVSISHGKTIYSIFIYNSVLYFAVAWTIPNGKTEIPTRSGKWKNLY